MGDWTQDLTDYFSEDSESDAFEPTIEEDLIEHFSTTPARPAPSGDDYSQIAYEGLKTVIRNRAKGWSSFLQPEVTKGELGVEPEGDWLDRFLSGAATVGTAMEMFLKPPAMVVGQQKASELLGKASEADVLQQDPDYQHPESFAGKVIEVGPQIGVQVAESVLLGGLPALTDMGMEILGGTVNELKAEGVDDRRATAFGLINAAIQAPLEQIGIGKTLKFWKTRGPFVKKMKELVGVAGTEWLTEFIQQFPDEALNIFATQPDKPMLDRTLEFLSGSIDTAKRGAEAGATILPWTILTGGAGAVGSGAARKKRFKQVIAKRDQSLLLRELRDYAESLAGEGGVPVEVGDQGKGFEKNSEGRLIGYKIMALDDQGRLRSGANAKPSGFSNTIGAEIAMPGQGVFLSNDPDYAKQYYSELADNEVLLKLEFDENDVVWGKSQMTDGEPEVGVSKARILETTPITTEGGEEAEPPADIGDAPDTPAFKKWFGESKVVDAAGKPLVVYHGDLRRKVVSLHPEEAVETAGVVFFTDNEDVAETFRYEREYGQVITEEYDEETEEYVDIEPGELVEAYINIKNPMILTEAEAQKATDDTAYQGEVVRKAKAEGHDGVIFKDVDEGVGDWIGEGTTYGVFAANQIKSTENVGTFRKDTDDIRLSKKVEAPTKAGLYRPAIRVGEKIYEGKARGKEFTHGAIFAEMSKAKQKAALAAYDQGDVDGFVDVNTGEFLTRVEVARRVREGGSQYDRQFGEAQSMDRAGLIKWAKEVLKDDAQATHREILADVSMVEERRMAIEKTLAPIIKRTKSAGKTTIHGLIANIPEEALTVKLKKEIEAGEKVFAWFDPEADEVHLVAENIELVDDAIVHWMHEQVGHRALREVFNDDALVDKFLLEIFPVLQAQDPDYMQAVIEGYEADIKTDKGKILAAEEFFAYRAGELTPETGKSVWRAFKALLEKWLDKLLGRGNYRLTDKDVSFVLNAAREYVFSGPGGFNQKSGRIPKGVGTRTLRAHPQYEAAKGGDVDAAWEVVADLVNAEEVGRFKKRNAIFVPVIADEAAGINKIPLALAHAYAKENGGEVDVGIVQTNRARHTDAGMMRRIVFPAEFMGAVKPGRKYVLVDDVVTSGGTLRTLRGHIDRRGGDVIGISVLTNASRRDSLSHNVKYAEDLKNAIQEEIGIDPQRLARPEAEYLQRFKTPERLRDKVAEERRKGSPETPPVKTRSLFSKKVAAEPAPKTKLSKKIGTTKNLAYKISALKVTGDTKVATVMEQAEPGETAYKVEGAKVKSRPGVKPKPLLKEVEPGQVGRLVKEAGTKAARITQEQYEQTIKTMRTAHRAYLKEGKDAAAQAVKVRMDETMRAWKSRKRTQKEVNKIIAALKAARKRAPKLSSPVKAGVTSLLDGIDFTKPTEKTTLKLQHIRDYLDNNPEAEVPDHVTGTLARLDKTPARDLKMNDLRDLYVGVKNLLHIEATKKKIKAGRRVRELEGLKAEALTQFKPAKAIKHEIFHEPTRFEKLGDWLEGFANVFGLNSYHWDWVVEKMAGPNSVVDRIVNKGVKAGIVKRMETTQESFDIFHQEIQTKGLVDAKGKGIRLLDEKGKPVKSPQAWLNQRVKTSTLGKPTRSERMSIYMMSQSPDNRRHLISGGFGLKFSGRPNKVYQMTTETLDELLDSITPEEEAFAVASQKVFNFLWEQESDIYYEKNGYRPQKVSGAYWPIKVMPISLDASEEAESALEKFKGRFVRPGAEKGHLKTRVPSKKPLYIMPFDVTLANSIRVSANYIGLEMPMTYASRLLFGQGGLQAEISDSYGEKYFQAIEQGLRDIVGEHKTYDEIEHWFRKYKNRFVVSVLGINPWVALKQPLSYALFNAYVDVEWMALAAAQYALNPIMVKRLHQKHSVEYRERRSVGPERELADIFKGKTKKRLWGGGKDWQERFMSLVKGFDLLAVEPGMHGAVLFALHRMDKGKLTKKMKEVLDMADKDIPETASERMALAYNFADHAVEHTQPMFSPEHRSAWSRGGVFAQTFTMFTSFTNMAFNLMSRVTSEAIRRPGSESIRKATSVYLTLLLLNPLGVMFLDRLRDKFYDRDDEDDPWLSFLDWMKSVGGYFYVIRDVVQGVARKLKGKWGDYQHPAGLPIQKTIDAATSISKALTEEEYGDREKYGKRAAEDVAELVALWKGIPLSTPKSVFKALTKEDDAWEE